MVLVNFFKRPISLKNRMNRVKAVLLILSVLSVMVFLQACAPANLTHVLFHDRPADPGEYYQVKIFHKGEPIETTPGMDLKQDSTIETNSQSWAVINFTSDVRVIIKPNTRVRIASFSLDFGEVLVEVFKKLQGQFSVKLEDVTAAPKSTLFSVTKTVDGPSIISVIRGTVELTSPNQSWPTTMVRQYQQAETVSIGRPELTPLEKIRFNKIVSWSNKVDDIVNPSKDRVTMPDLQSIPKEEAMVIIEQAGLRPGKITPMVTDNRPPIGTVVKQHPRPGIRVKKGTVVDIGIEVEPVQIPLLINEPFSTAEQMIYNSGLTLGRMDRRITGTAPAETVIGQNPSQGETVPKGSEVNLVVEAESVLVPDLRRMSRDEANTSTMNQRLTVQRWDEEITGSQPPLTVLRQYPEPNKRVRPGTGIRIVLEAVSVAVPNVVGQHKSNAAALLGQEQLTLGTITERVTGQHTVGVVFQQNPEPGQRVKPGTKVHLQAEAVSVLVPGIVGLSRELAGNKLRNLNLVFGNMTKEVRDNVTDDTILNQSPGPGQRVALHTPVSVTFSVRGTRVPNLGRQSQQAAMKILHTHNLRLGSVATRESNHRNHWGTILDQSPRSGTLVQFGSQVNIVVGSRAMCTVPNVVGMNAVNADNTIRANRLAPRNNKRVTGTKNRVSRQYPAAGKRIYCGDTVSYDAFSVVQMAPMKPGTILTIPKNIQIIPPSRID